MSRPVTAIVGVGPGNGAAFARRFASEEHRVALCSRSLDTLEAMAAELPDARAYAYDAGFDAMCDLLAEKKVEAVFCGDDLICMGAMDAARKRGFAIPQDIGFIGFNDMTMSGWKSRIRRMTCLR